MDTRERPRPRRLVVAAAVRPVAVPVPPPAPAAPGPAAPVPAAAGPGQSAGPGRVLCWQVATVLVTIASRQPLPVSAVLVAAAAALVVSTVVRRRGVRLYQIAAGRCRFAVRKRRRWLPARGDKSRVLLGLLLPGSAAGDTDTGQGPVATISHPAGLTAIIRPRAVGTAPISSFPAPVALLRGLPAGVGVQLVFHSGARSEGSVRIWLAVHAGRNLETPSDDELIPLLHNGLRRVRRSLDKAGVPTGLLPVDTGLAAVTALAHVGQGRDEIREAWRFWRTGTVSQACFSLRGGDESDLHRLADGLLSHTPGVAVTVTLSARGGSTDALLRFAATTEAAVDAAADRAARLFSATDIQFRRLDGIHRRAVAASLPIGGFLCRPA
ncbi:hypothetical protein [Amycolatopsis taiwanensis]|uniref:hypothetical protein n=1 Tax=Amycolatopsis taiwanensis TaxID=342230 RepID=UPI0004ADB93D|nr:hypothetical protein [Amycolatopsis taiwanensis]